jgi:hypothetical protein
MFADWGFLSKSLGINKLKETYIFSYLYTNAVVLNKKLFSYFTFQKKKR